jgi:hypothetical protein
MIRFALILLYLSLAWACDSNAADGKLIGTAGLMQLEGAGGGGIVPWATLSGYDSRDEISVNAMATRVEVNDFRLNVLGASVSIYDKLEVSVAQHLFDVPALNTQIEQQIVGVKYRVYGDAVYSRFGQVSAGWMHKRLKDGDVADLLGAQNAERGNDFYIAATKIHLGALAGYNIVYNITARATKANQLGLLGFGGLNNESYKIMFEGSFGVLLSRHLAIGAEFRQKPDSLGLGEEHWRDVFVAYIPNKNFNVTVAWADLGSIAGGPQQQGIYLSLSGSLQ